ncbi:hypothetical protein SB861_05230 [Paraburkholderia sp. SIMBA_049]
MPTFLAPPRAQAPLLHVDIVNPHRERRTDPREPKHQCNQRATPEAYRRRHIDAVEQQPRLGCIEHRDFSRFRGVARAAHRR